MEKLIVVQLRKVYSHFNSNEIVKDDDISKQINKTEQKLKSLKIRYGFQELEEDVYQLTKSSLEEALSKMMSVLNNLHPTVSNLENMIEKSVKSLQDISKIWSSVAYNNKHNINEL